MFNATIRRHLAALRKPFPISKAKQLLASAGYTFLRTYVLVERYDWNTTHRQGDSGLNKTRLYVFAAPSGHEIAMTTQTLRAHGKSIAHQAGGSK